VPVAFPTSGMIGGTALVTLIAPALTVRESACQNSCVVRGRSTGTGFPRCFECQWWRVSGADWRVRRLWRCSRSPGCRLRLWVGDSYVV
jgi:hypothetical protein